MGTPKLHHYVPQFHLRRFCDHEGKIWVWDKINDSVFATDPRNIAAEKNFYFLSEFEEQDLDPLEMERQFSDLEYQVSIITDQWINWLRDIKLGAQIDIPTVNREIVSLHIALQFLRTADSRDILAALAGDSEEPPSLLKSDLRNLHTNLLWDEGVFGPIADKIRESTWVFGRNSTSTPFLTSDNPVAFRTSNNAMWLKAYFLSNGTYVVYPMAPDIIMYCYPKVPPWEKSVRFDACLSPVEFSDGMVDNDSTGQAFMALRFVISSIGNFSSAREFAKTIGTDQYARK